MPQPPSSPPPEDRRWRVIDAAMRRHGYRPHALIETLHAAQESFGYLEEPVLRRVAEALNVPLSRAFGVATFYHHFTLKPQGRHTCVVCTGTACYIKGSPQILAAIDDAEHLKPGQTSAGHEASLLTARCLGSCGLAPAVVFDGEVTGRVTPAAAAARVRGWFAGDA